MELWMDCVHSSSAHSDQPQPVPGNDKRCPPWNLAESFWMLAENERMPSSLYLQSWARCVGHFAFCAEFLQYSLPPIAWGKEGGKVNFGPKNGLFSFFFFMWKTIDGRGMAFCKCVPHNVGQDCWHDSETHRTFPKVSPCKLTANWHPDLSFLNTTPQRRTRRCSVRQRTICTAVDWWRSSWLSTCWWRTSCCSICLSPYSSECTSPNL